MLLGIGTMFVAHIPKGWDHRAQRVAGIVLTGVPAVLVVTGRYLLYYAGGEALREWSSLTHWIIGLALPAVFLWHYINGQLVRRRKAK